ncbi:MAG: hypothetical protein K2X86_05185 [Cytophagaceae bacterium]|nr:hypothetical protein [Cytophagaceae bacterium]
MEYFLSLFSKVLKSMGYLFIIQACIGLLLFFLMFFIKDEYKPEFLFLLIGIPLGIGVLRLRKSFLRKYKETEGKDLS